jgi:glycerol-3-phosphate cytidylyltransferase
MHSPNFPTRGGRVIYCFDLDGTICTSVKNSQYALAQPDNVVINNIRSLYEHGHIIKIMTARGCVSKVDHTDLTRQQLKEWGVPYHELIMNVKPHADLFIDDKAINIIDWKKKNLNKFGILAGAFDIIHPGYVRMFKEAKAHCNYLTVALHVDPSLENGKSKPIHSVDEREEILLAMRDVDEVVRYKTEEDLYKILDSKFYDIRFLGSDYLYRQYTGPELTIPIIWINRNHNYSTTNLKIKIKESL